MMTAKTALRIKVAESRSDLGYCAAVIAFDDGTVVDTPVRSYSELRAKATDHGLDMERDVVASPATITWLKDQEGWPEDAETVGRV